MPLKEQSDKIHSMSRSYSTTQKRPFHIGKNYLTTIKPLTLPMSLTPVKHRNNLITLRVFETNRKRSKACLLEPGGAVAEQIYYSCEDAPAVQIYCSCEDAATARKLQLSRYTAAATMLKLRGYYSCEDTTAARILQL
jgi:hypothetical protein